MSNSNPKYLLRSEASPIEYWKHHKRAKDAIDFIIRGLKAAIDSVEGGKGVNGNHAVDTNRASRIIFVSGEPGSGKSSLYLTLREMLHSKGKNEYRLGYEGNGKVGLDELKGVRWLDALDLEVASEEGENLLAAVLVRLIEVLTSPDTVSNTVQSKPCGDAIKDLEELATDIGIAWEGNLRARAGELDPDTYSEEVMRAQRARLRVNERLRGALDELAKNNCHGCSEGTLFVLPVDDLYLKPDVSLQLLRLLRMISIPRLFFLIMGDIKTVEALFIEKSLADWTEVAGTRLFASRSERLDGALTRARELRARYLRKLLPPLQRKMIEPMDWHEALDFEPGRPGASVDALEELLAQVKMDKPFGTEDEGVGDTINPESLLNFLISPALPASEEERRKERGKRQKRAQGDKDATEEPPKEIRLKKLRSAYTALQILDATPREMMDLGSALREVISGKAVGNDRTPDLLSRVRDMVNLVREEQSFLSEKEQEVLENILPTREYSPEDINFEMDRLCLNPSKRTWQPQIPEPLESEPLELEQLWVRNHRSWDLTVNSIKDIDDPKNKGTEPDEYEGMESSTNDQFSKLPPRPAAWLVLLHDLAWKWKRDSINKNLIKELCKELNEWKAKRRDEVSSPPEQETYLQLKYLSLIKPKKVPDPSSDFSGWAIWFNGLNYNHFPMPEFETFRDLDRFLFIWSGGIDWLEKRKKQAEEAQKRADEAQKLAERAKSQIRVDTPQQPTQADQVQKITTTEEADRLAKEAEEANREAIEAQRLVGVDTRQKIHKFLSVWALAGWTVLNHAYRNFAESGSTWYEDFDMITGNTFDIRFTDFKGKLQNFQYPTEDSQLKKWLLKLSEWPEKEKPFINSQSEEL
jgi:hypothetical protein